MKRSDLNRGFTLIEVAVVFAIISVLAIMAVPSFGRWQSNQSVKSAGQSLAAAFSLAHGEAIRTGSLHIVFFQTDAQGNTLFDINGTAVPALVINDGRPGDANQNCKIDAGEIVGGIRAEPNVSWGPAPGAVRVPSDSGAGAIATGSSFTDPDTNAATWAMFRPEGFPISFTPACVLGGTGSGAGAVYVTNGQRDYAVVLSPIGSVFIHASISGSATWTN